MGEQLRLPDEYVGGLTGPAAVRPPATIQARAEIARLQASGYGYSEIARSLNRRGIPTPTGRGRWWPESAKRHLHPEPWAEYMRRKRGRSPR